MDPIAQAFSVKNTNGGCFITSIDVFFRAKSINTPVNLLLTQIIGGAPSNAILAEAIKQPADVAVSTDASLATTFAFSAPVFVEDGDYAFVLESNSQEYYAWIATIGQSSVSSPTTIWKPAADGQMLTCINKQSWIPVPASDIKYVIRKAVFNTAIAGNLVLRNRSPAVKTFTGDLIETVASSASLKIYVQHHGMTAGVSKVRLEFDAPTESYGGIVASTMNTNTYTVQTCGWNYITITAPSAAATTATTYTKGVAITVDAPMDMILLKGVVQPHIGTSTKTKIRTTSGRSISGTQTPYVKDVNWTYMDLNSIYKFDVPRLVASYPNELLNMTDSSSFEIGVEMTTNNPNLSPVVHINKFGAVIAGNVMNSDLTNETSSRGGNALARYVTKAVQLQNPATALQIILSANVPLSNTISVYYKIKSPKSSGSIDTESWVQMNPLTPLIQSSNRDEFIEYTYQANALTQYTSFKIKVVFSGTNSAMPPMIRDFRFMALAV